MESSAPLFRLASAADSDRVAALHAASWRVAYRGMLPDSYLDGELDADRAQLWRERLARPSERQYVLLAEADGELAGFVCVLLDAEPTWGACLDNLHVRPGATGRGLGAQLFGRAARWLAGAAPGWPMHLWVFEANVRARRFYERLGGEAVERTEKLMPGGVTRLVLRYLWRDVARLLDAPPPGRG